MMKMGFVLAAALLCTCVLAQPAPAAGEPTAFEMEVWKATTKIDTPAAYVAYLARFPNGAFAPQATMLAGKVERSEGGDSLGTSALHALQSTPAETGAAAFRIGDRFFGPGAVTVGWWGAKRQVVIPSGEWVVLTAYDHKLTTGSSLQLSTISMGQFVSNELQKLLVFTSNTRSLPTGSGGVSLPMGGDCALNDETVVYIEADPSYSRKICASVRTLTRPGLSAELPPGMAERLERALQRTKARAGKFTYRTDLTVAAANAYSIGYTRLDVGQANAKEQRINWLKAFRPLALAGAERDIAGEDLEPEAAAKTPPFDLRD